MSETLVNTIDGDKLYAERALKDASGNSISETYATKSEIPVVDQTYDATSTNAQSGVAVAEALSNVPSPLSAGDGIDITSDVVSAKVDGSTISFNASGELQATVSGGVTDVTVDGTSVVNAQGVAEITMPTFTQVQSDWSQSDNTQVDYIKNKPSLATVATSGDYDDLTNKPSIPAAQVNSDWNASSGVAEILNKPTLATVATSGDYDDLTNKPTINNVPSVGSTDDGKALVAHYSGGSGSYSWDSLPSEIFPVEYGVTTYAAVGSALAAGKLPVLKVVDTSNATHIAALSYCTSTSYTFTHITNAVHRASGTPSNFTAFRYKLNSDDTWGSDFVEKSDFQADWNQTSINDLGYIQNKPNLATVATTGAYSDLTGTPTLATVATTGAYSDLSGTPTIPAAQVNSDWNASSGVAEILNKPTLATVATSGSYNDLSDKPTIPTMELFEAVYGTTTYADITAAIAAKKIVYCRVSPSGATRMAFLAYIGSNNVEFQYYRSLSSRSATNQLDEVYVYTVSSSGWTTTTRKVGVLIAAGTGLTSSYARGTLTINGVATDQTYDGTSTNPQSGVAVAGALAGKEDAFTVGDGLEMVTSGNTRTLQVEAPVDIVAGPGIVIDNPDGNTMRVSQAYPTDETTLFETSTPTDSCTLSETLLNFEKIAIYSQTAGGASLITLFTAVNGVVNMSYFKGNNYPLYVMARLNFNGVSISANASIGLAYTWGSTSNPTIRANNSEDLKLISKVIGIHRIASN